MIMTKIAILTTKNLEYYCPSLNLKNLLHLSQASHLHLTDLHFILFNYFLDFLLNIILFTIFYYTRGGVNYYTKHTRGQEVHLRHCMNIFLQELFLNTDPVLEYRQNNLPRVQNFFLTNMI